MPLAVDLGFMVLGALPTRWNSADHPTRDSRIPAPFPCQIASLDDPLQVHALARLRGLRRWAANCARLAILLAPGILDYVISPADILTSWLPSLDFDSTRLPRRGPADSAQSPLICRLAHAWIFSFPGHTDFPK